MSESGLDVKLTKAAIELIEGKNFAHLATLMKDGSPHVAPVWVNRDGDFILVNTATGRVKERNVARDPRVALSIVDQNNPYHMVAIRGRVVSLTTEGADAHIDRLSKKYLGKDKYPYRQPGQKRVTIKVKPEHIAMQ